MDISFTTDELRLIKAVCHHTARLTAATSTGDADDILVDLVTDVLEKHDGDGLECLEKIQRDIEVALSHPPGSHLTG